MLCEPADSKETGAVWQAIAAQREAAQVWNVCVDAHRQARMSHARWPEYTKACPDRRGSGLNEYNVPVCRSPAEAEAFAGPGKGLLFNESSVHE